MTVDVAKVDEPTLALLSAISKEKGQEHWKIFDKSVNVAKFQEWLSEMRARNPDDKICLFMDQLSSHTSERSKKYMKDLGFRYVYNVGYSPQYNPIELVFSKVKHSFKALRAKKLAGVIQNNHRSCVEMAVKSVRKKDIINCVDHVLKLIT